MSEVGEEREWDEVEVEENEVVVVVMVVAREVNTRLRIGVDIGELEGEGSLEGESTLLWL